MGAAFVAVLVIMDMMRLFDHVPPALVASLVAAFFALAGILAVILNGESTQRHAGKFAAFAAGVLITSAFVLMPETWALLPNAHFYALLGYCVLLLINLLFGSERSDMIYLAPLIAIGLHSFIDGLEYGILFAHDVRLASIASVGLIVHEFAEGVILFLLLTRSGLGKFAAFILAFLGASVTTPLGTVAAMNSLDYIEGTTLAILLAMASGALIYVGATHLVHHIRDNRTSRLSAIIFFSIGLVFAYGMTRSHSHGEVGHGHELHESHDSHDDHDDHDH